MKINEVLQRATLCLVLFGGLTSDKAAIAAEEGPASAARYLKLLSAGDLVVLSTVTTFVDIPGMEASVNVARRDSCVTAVFSAEVSGVEIHLRALLDDVNMEGHRAGISTGVLHATATGLSNLVSYTFWQCGVSRGPHTIKIQWGTSRPNVSVSARTLVVEGG
jgi:hypothetical protein